MLSPADHFHPLDILERWGCTFHGLLTRSPTRQIKMGEYQHGFGLDEMFDGQFGTDVEFLMAQSPGPFQIGQHSAHLLKLAVPTPLELTPEQIDAEQAQGRNWLDHAIVYGGRNILFGHALDGWVCVDATGARWHIKPVAGTIHHGLLAIDAPLTVALDVRPFGYLGEPTADPVRLEQVMPSIGQVSADPVQAYLGVPVRSVITAIHPQGREALVALFPPDKRIPYSSENGMPIGWLRIELIGDGPDFELQATVLYSRDQALGEFEEDIDNSAWLLQGMQPEFETTVEMHDGNTRLVATPTGELLPSSSPGAQYGHRHLRRSHTGRVCQVSYNRAGERVTLTADLELAIEVDWQVPTFESISGTLWSEGASAVNGGEVTAEYRRQGTDILTAKITTYRNGVELEAAEWTAGRTLDHTSTSVWTKDNVTSAAYPGAEPPLLAISVSVFLSWGTAPITHQLKIGGTARWEWNSAPVSYAYLNPASRAAPLTARPWSVELLTEIQAAGRPARWVGYRVMQSTNHVLGFSWYQLGEFVANPESPWVPAYMRWHRYAATEADWVTDSWASGPYPFKDTMRAAYNPETLELVVPNTDTDYIAGYFI